MGSSLFVWGEQLQRGLGIEPSELTLIYGDDASGDMTNIRK